jgi:hypothetical protein
VWQRSFPSHAAWNALIVHVMPCGVCLKIHKKAIVGQYHSQLGLTAANMLPKARADKQFHHIDSEQIRFLVCSAFGGGVFCCVCWRLGGV